MELSHIHQAVLTFGVNCLPKFVKSFLNYKLYQDLMKIQFLPIDSLELESSITQIEVCFNRNLKTNVINYSIWIGTSCMLCWTGLNWFMGYLGSVARTAYSIFAQTSQEGIECTKVKEYLAKSLLLNLYQVENTLEDNLDLIPSPSHLVKIQIIGGKVYLRY